MTTSYFVHPSKIEEKLISIWDDFGSINKVRASLFTLVVYTKTNSRSEYIRKIVQSIIEKFPCRVIFISSNNENDADYIKTAVSLITPEKKSSTIACDNIDILVGGKSNKIVPFLILPHILTDLPVYLLWAEDICNDSQLFDELKKISNRVIVDSETSQNINDFAKAIKSFIKTEKTEIADLNWARTQNFRDLLNQLFQTENRIKKLENIQSIEIEYNNQKSSFFCHTKIKALYLQAWIATRLNWEYKDLKEEKTTTTYNYLNNASISLMGKPYDPLYTGAIASIKIKTKEDIILLKRDTNNWQSIKIEFTYKDQCEIPIFHFFEKSITGMSLINEIYYPGISEHFIKTLDLLTKGSVSC